MFEYVCLSAVKWQGGDARLTIHYDSGFTLHTVVPSEGPEPSTSTPTTVAWSYPYEKLRMTGDDGHRLLWLEFSDGSEQVYFDEYFFFLNLITYCSLLKVLFSFTWNKSYEGNIFMCDISFHNVNYYVRKQMKNLPIKAMSSWF